MEIERMTAKVRPRKGWEAIDLGVALVQQHTKDLYKIWLFVTLPVFLVLSLAMIKYSIWPVVIFWWLKPLWERPMLHYLSRELFGERLRVKDCAKAFFSLAKIQWFASITWRRLSFTRSLDLPVIQLEGLSGMQRSQRLSVIHSVGSGSAIWMTIFFVCLELIFYFSFISLAYLLMPAPLAENIDVWEWMFGEAENVWENLLLNWLSFFAYSLVAPFFTACGFALYLNQRTHLEAWDIELSFKRLAKRLTEQSEQHPARLASRLLPVLLAVGLSVAMPGELNANASEVLQQAAETSGESADDKQQMTDTGDAEAEEKSAETPMYPLDHEQAKALINEIKEGEVFNQTEIRHRFQKRNPDPEPEIAATPDRTSPIWEIVGWLVSFIVEFFMWVLVAIMVIFLIARYRHLLTGVKRPSKQKKRRPKTLFGLDLETENLPDQPWQVAAKLLEQGRVREAISLLYRASLIWYMDNTTIHIKEGDTELECLNKLSKVSSRPAASFMQLLTGDWRQLAYAHQTPELSNLHSRCEEWPEHFAKPAQGATDEN